MIKKGKGFKDRKLNNVFFISPEMFIGNYDEKNDIWGVGTLLFFLVTGKTLYQDGTDSNLYQNLVVSKKVNLSPLKKIKISPKFYDFIKQILHMDPQKRPSCTELLNHDWFTMTKYQKFISMKNITHSVKEISERIHVNKRARRSSCKDFNSIREFYLDNLLTVDDKIEMDKIFLQFDKNNDGVLSIEDFKEYGDTKLLDQIQQVLKQVKGQGSKEIKYSEFIKAFSNYDFFQDEERMLEFFHYMDKDSRGQISQAELF